MLIHSRMAAMHPMERWINIVTRSQGSEGLPSSGDSGVCRGSENKSQAGYQLAGKGGIK